MAIGYYRYVLNKYVIVCVLHSDRLLWESERQGRRYGKTVEGKGQTWFGLLLNIMFTRIFVFITEMGIF